MPTNLPPEYFAVDKRYRAATDPREKAQLLEELLGTIPKHKGTDHLRADLRRKLSKLKVAAQTKKKAGRQDSAYRIDREGAGQAVIVGMPNVGKSALVVALTNASPEVAEFPFTTWSPTPGMMQFENVQIQLIDTPPLNREYIEPALMDLVRRCDLVLLMVDLQGFPLEQLEGAAALLEEHRILPRHRQNQFPDAHRLTFKPFLVLANKCDHEGLCEEFEVLQELMGEEWPMLSISAVTGRNLDRFRRAVFDLLEIIRVYSKPPGREPNLESPFVLRQGGTVEEFAAAVHQDFYTNLKTARVWGSVTHDGLMVGRDYVLHDGDVVELRI